jgi:hypothetical protein
VKQNVGILDTAVRGIISVILLAIAAEGLFNVEITITLAALGVLLGASASFGVCFIYKIFGIDTYPGAGHGLCQYYPRT